MHIPDGILPPPLWIGGYGIAAVITTLTLGRIQRQSIQHRSDPTEQIPKAALMTAAFFVGSSIYLPFGPTSIHLLLNGLMGILLGIYSFPAIVVGLLFQALMIGHGGITTLGVNGVLLGIPALLARPVFGLYRRLPLQWGIPWTMGLMAFVASGLSTALTVLIFFGLLMSSLDPALDAAQEQQAITILALAHIPLMVLEGAFAVCLVIFLQRVRPELLEDPV